LEAGLVGHLGVELADVAAALAAPGEAADAEHRRRETSLDRERGEEGRGHHRRATAPALGVEELPADAELARQLVELLVRRPRRDDAVDVARGEARVGERGARGLEQERHETTGRRALVARLADAGDGDPPGEPHAMPPSRGATVRPRPPPPAACTSRSAAWGSWAASRGTPRAAAPGSARGARRRRRGAPPRSRHPSSPRTP